MLPKVSCLMVTCGRIAFVKRAIQCYCDQTYSNRELVIVTNESEPVVTQLRDCITSFGTPPDIRLFVLEDRKYTLGELRNKSIKAAKGEIICNWDDDDLYHYDRIKLQYEDLQASNSEVSLLSDYLHFFWTDSVLGWCVWRSNFPDSIDGLPGSIMMYKHLAVAYPNSGKYANSGEDSYFLYGLYQNGVKFSILKGQGHLYLYSHHGANTWSKAHHLGLFYQLHKKMELLTFEQRQKLNKSLKYFPLPANIKLV